MNNHSKSKIHVTGKFQYLQTGSGAPVVLLHGLMGNLSNWQHTMDHFSSSHQIFAPIFPMFDHQNTFPNISGLSRYIAEFLTEMKVINPVVAGNSLGGHVALMLARDNPQLLKAMVLTGSSGLYEQGFGGGYPPRANYDYIRKKTEFTFYNPDTAYHAMVDDVYRIVNDRKKMIRILGFAKSAIRDNMGSVLPDIQTPTCLIWGREDKITPPEVAREFLSGLPNAELHWISHCGHAPMMEKPAVFNAILEDFLIRLG
ncbi:MAG: alpha/beta fold hydrolase [Chitinophagaceae bacterium]|nr:MAG: alpha/beta fold hydrolase [Chitinophagaceae bacterium]